MKTDMPNAMDRFLTVRVESVEGDLLTTKTTDGQTLRLPASAVAGTAKAGTELRLMAVAVGSEDAGRTEFAKRLLDELVGS